MAVMLFLPGSIIRSELVLPVLIIEANLFSVTKISVTEPLKPVASESSYEIW